MKQELKRHLAPVLLLALMGCFWKGAAAQVVPLPHAYAHNDYWHPHPLSDALANGFTHVEADVYLRRHRLVVAHRPPIFRLHRRGKTIQDLYLEPLLNRFASENKQTPSAMDTIVLMVDVKSKSKRTYAALKKLLEKYKPMLSTCDDGKVTIRNLTVVLTGHRSLNQLENESSRLVFADEDLRKINPAKIEPSICATASCKYSSLLKWKGKGIMPPWQKFRLQQLVAKAHQVGAKVRLWGSPENERVWTQLLNCGVDLINTDKLVALKSFFINGSL